MKVCGRCRAPKPVSEFNKRTRAQDGLQNHCRACTSAYYLGNADRHKAHVVTRNQRILSENKQRVYDYLLAHPCVDCGEPDPVVLDFDHVRGEKKSNVSRMTKRYTSWSTIQKEIDKCEVRCANCHRRRTARQYGWYAALITG